MNLQEKRKRDRSADASDDEGGEVVEAPAAKRIAVVKEVVKEGGSTALAQTLDYLHKTLQRCFISPLALWTHL